MEEERSSIATRATSAFPISIGTSLALESLFTDTPNPSYDESRKIPQEVPLDKYQEIWINIFTLYRNLIQSMKSEVIPRLTVDELVYALLSEIEVITSLFQNEGQGKCKPIFYHCSYKKLYTHQFHKSVILRTEKTENQKLIKSNFQKVMEKLLKLTDKIHELDSELKRTGEGFSSALIITHIPYDLLSHNKFSRLDLLESNTGKLKPKFMWNTKYAPVGDRDTSMLPFLRKLLMVFGDKVFIHPAYSKLRHLILDIAEKRKWTPAVTESQMMLHFSLDVQEPFVLKFLRDL